MPVVHLFEFGAVPNMFIVIPSVAAQKAGIVLHWFHGLDPMLSPVPSRCESKHMPSAWGLGCFRRGSGPKRARQVPVDAVLRCQLWPATVQVLDHACRRGLDDHGSVQMHWRVHDVDVAAAAPYVRLCVHGKARGP